MRIFFLLPVISLLATFQIPHLEYLSEHKTDSTNIIHLLDGNIAEWPPEKFAIDKATKIRYAIDNDDQLLFLAISISDKNQQQRIVQKGMSLFVDVKGKKKENHGVEFPLGVESGSSIETMKVFGFNNAEPLPQNVKTEGTINIAIGWDTSFILSIEYSVPLRMLEGLLEELKNKKISLGWKINEGVASNNTRQPVATSSTIVSVPSSGRPASNRTAGPTRNDPFPQSNTDKAQLMWTTHTIIL